MRLHMKPYRVFREAIDPLPGWQREPWEWLLAVAVIAARELWEWLLAVAVMAACAWIFHAVGGRLFLA
jgi:hypothetical protein